MIETLPHFKEAEALRKTDPAQALELFQRLWEVTKQFRAARGYAYCLRKAGRVEDAIAICHAALELYPTNKIIRNELAWALYEIKIKPAKENGDLRSILAAAKEIFGLEPDPMAQQKVAIKVIQVAKANGRWNVVLEWTNRFKPDDFSSESFPSYGKKLMSDREIFYNAKSRALYETKGFSESRTFAQAGLAEYPDDIFLARTAALALAEEGQVETAAEELRQLIMKRHAEWYVKVELADLEIKLGHAAIAYRLCCEAAQHPQDEEFKLSLFSTLARAAIATSQLLVAAEHIALSKALRESNGWKIPQQLMQLDAEVRTAMKETGVESPVLPSDVNELSNMCQSRWREGSSAGLTRKTGRLGRIDPTKSFSFIISDDRSGKIFVRMKNVPKALAVEGKRVEFVLKPSFDMKKQVESFEAVALRAV